MKKSVLVAIVAALALTSSVQADETTREDSKLYTQATGDAYMAGCDAADPDIGGVGGVCFSLVGDELDVASVVIDDETDLPVGGYWAFSSSLGLEGDELASSAFCGSASDIEIPEGARFFSIFVDGPVNGPLDCLLAGHTSPGIGIRGTVTVTYNL